MNSIHNKGFFKAEKQKKFKCCRRIYLYFALTALGLLIMPIIDLLLKVEAVIRFLSIPLICKSGNEKKTISRKIHENI